MGEASTQIKKSTERPMVRSVMFVPFTWDGILVKRLRSSEEKMTPLTNWRVKFVEIAGVKLKDVLQPPTHGRERTVVERSACSTRQSQKQES